MLQLPAGINAMLPPYFLFLPLSSSSSGCLLFQLPFSTQVVAQLAHPTHLLCNRRPSAALVGDRKGILNVISLARIYCPDLFHCVSCGDGRSVSNGAPMVGAHLKAAHPLILGCGFYLTLMFS